MIEKSLQDVLNAALGLLKESEKGFQAALESVGKAFEDLKTRGAEDNSEAAQKMREALDNTLRGVRDVSSAASENLNKVMEEARKNYAQILEQARTVVGEERIRDLNTRFDELAQFVQAKSDDVSQAASKMKADAEAAVDQARKAVSGDSS